MDKKKAFDVLNKGKNDKYWPLLQVFFFFPSSANKKYWLAAEMNYLTDSVMSSTGVDL